VADSDIDERAVDRLVERARDALPAEHVHSAFAGKQGLAPMTIALLAAIPGVVVVAIALVVGQPLLLVVALVVMGLAMAVLMVTATSTRIVAETRTDLVVLGSHAGALTVIDRVPKAVTVEAGSSRSWLRVHIAGQLLWVSRPAFGGVVERFSATADDAPDGS
jgi:hypothetical protein